MKIGNPNDKPVAAPAPVTSARTSGTPAGKTQTAATQDAGVEASTQVAISTAASQLLSGDTAVSGDFDTAKVERIAKAISEGKFEVNAGAIADKLLANAREVLGGPSH